MKRSKTHIPQRPFRRGAQPWQQESLGCEVLAPEHALGAGKPRWITTTFFEEKRHEQLPGTFAPRRGGRRYFLKSAAAANVAVLTLGSASAALADRDDDRGHGQQWVASWATAPQPISYTPRRCRRTRRWHPLPRGFTTANIQPDLAFPFPMRPPPGRRRSARPFAPSSSPTFGRHDARAVSNVFGNVPLTFNSVTIGLQE